jgi:hypothetical protein
MALSNLTRDGVLKGPFSLGTKTLGTAWGNIGTAVEVQGVNSLRGYFGLQIHAGTNVRLRGLAYHASGGSGFGLPNYDASGTGTTEVLPLVWELGSDVDQYITVKWDLDGTVPWFRVQGMISGGSATYISQAQLVAS